MGADNLFYSRRIGRYPHLYPAVDEGEFVDMPEATRILGAMKLSGKTKNGLSVGILESVTANEKAEIDSAGHRRKESVEPLTNYFVSRVQQDFNKGQTTIGGIFTSVNRDINNVALDFLHRSAYTGGIDFRHSWDERTWYVAGNAEFSTVRGKPEAMIATQEASARYYQRPDADYVEVDSSRTSLEGYGGTVKFGRFSQKLVQFETSFTVRSPGLEFNDIGFMRYADVLHHGTWVAFYKRNPFWIFNNFYLNTNYWMYWNFSGNLLSTYLNTNFNSQFKNRWRMNGNTSRIMKNNSTTMLRGGPTFKNTGGTEVNLNLSTDQSKKISVFAGNYHGFGDLDSYREHEYYAGLTIQPLNALSVSFNPDYYIQNNILQYVETADLNGDPRYLFGEIDQQTMSFTFRINYAINPELSIEYYGQPFVSAGEYTNYKRITDPVAANFRDRYHIFSMEEISYDEANNQFHVDEDVNGSTDYSFGNPDFNFRQFRSNLVIRWEYLPGSTLFFVWSQGRTSTAAEGSFNYGNDMKELFTEEPDNIFLVKLSYWFSL
jgi:hypothetical protein